MKQLTKTLICKSTATLFFLCFFKVMALAQDNSESTGTATTIGRYTWYTQPWALITGITLVLIIIISLVPTNSPGNNRNADKVNYLDASEDHNSN